MKILFILFCSFTSTLFCQTSMEHMSFLEGTWKVENKEQYEVWKLKDSTTLEGFGYVLKGGNKFVTETLTISLESGQFIYKATVPNQNNGNTISFVLNENIGDAWSFENETHDFPKKITYKKLNDTNMEVIVMGDNNRGFSYRMTKQ